MADVQLLRREDLAVVRCPKCRGLLSPRTPSPNGDIEDGFLDCEKCGEWPVEDGLPVLVDGDSLHVADRFFRLVYGLVAPFHDAGVHYVLSLIQWSSEASMRGHYLRRMRLHTLTETEDRPLRILEVGAGTGVNWRLIEDRLPVGSNVEFWAVDLNRNMLDRSRRRAQREVGRRVRHLLADAHALPFEDASFDRVFHVGGIASYGDKRKALAEMARVARPGTPIVVVDERLDPMRFHLPYHYVMFRALTAYDLRPHAPVDDLPCGSKHRLTQASRFYYCLTFETWSPQLDNDYRSNDMAQPTAIAELGKILKDKQIATLKAAYGDGKSMSNALAQYLPVNYAATSKYSEAVINAFYSTTMSHTGPRLPSRSDRERCLIAILTSRGPNFNLGVHIYMGLMHGVSAEEIANIIFLAGIYSGIDHLTDGFRVQRKTLEALGKLVDGAGKNRKADLSPGAVLGEIQKALA